MTWRLRFSRPWSVRGTVGLFGAVWVGVGTACAPPQQLGEGCTSVPGALKITEVMIDPEEVEGAAASDHEWFEIFNADERTQVLNRLRWIRRVDGEVRGWHEIRGADPLPPGAYRVLGAGSAAHIDYNYERVDGAGERVGETLGALSNAGGWALEVWCGATLLDALVFDDSPVRPGQSWARDDAEPSAAGTRPWCWSESHYSDLNQGSPGAPNDTCGLWECWEAGTRRPVQSPGPGELVLSEILPNPLGVDVLADDGINKYWFEVFVGSAHPVDLNGLQLWMRREGRAEKEHLAAEVASATCVRGEPGQFVVVGASVDPQRTGGVVADAIVPDMALRASGLFGDEATVLELRHNARQIDRALVAGDTVAGASWALDALALRMPKSARQNAGTAVFCNGRVGDAAEPEPHAGFWSHRATPGRPNWACGRAFCQDPHTEDPRAVRAAGEAALVVTEVFADAAGADAGREWIEVYNAAAAALDLNGLTVRVETEGAATVREVAVAPKLCAEVEPGAYAVVAFAGAAGERSPPWTCDCEHCVPALCALGQKASQVVASASSGLPNGAALRVELVHRGGVVDLARVPPAVQGRSQELSVVSPTSADNDVDSAFRPAAQRGLFAGQGTPGVGPGRYCVEGPQARPVVGPRMGDVAVTEIFADPSGADRGRDWLELYVNGPGPVDLNGLRIGHQARNRRSWTLDPSACWSVAPQTFVVIGGEGARADGVVLDQTFGAPKDSLLYSGLAVLEIGFDDVILDITAPLDALSGRSFGIPLAPGVHRLNDVADAWCVGSRTSPGADHACAP